MAEPHVAALRERKVGILEKLRKVNAPLETVNAIAQWIWDVDEALASLPQQETAEPVAWRWRPVGVTFGDVWSVGISPPRESSGWTVEPLYLHPASPPVGGAVKGKPLEWRNNGWTWDAKTPFGFYEIDGESASDSPRFRLEWQGLFVADSDDLEAMKAAAQADFEQRILSALASSERSGREAVVCSVKTMKLSDGREDHYVSIRVGDREITPYKFTIKGRAEYEVAELNWLLNGAEKPDILDWLDRTRDPNAPTEAAIRNLAGTKTNG
jgi:hypothetical protein